MEKQTGIAPTWAATLIVAGAGLFLVALLVSAYLIPQIRVLHVLQALVYFAVLVLTRRRSPWAFGAGTIVAVAWNALSIFITHLFQVGIAGWVLFARTGNVTRPDTLMVALGGIGHFLMVVGCVAAFVC